MSLRALSLLLFSVSLLSGARAPAAVPELGVYTYDSFAAEGGLGRELVPRFEAQCACKVKLIPCGDGAQLLTRLQLDEERGKWAGQVAVGLDQRLWPRAKAHAEDWGRWRPARYERLRPEVAGLPPGFLPFDFGAFAFIADREQLAELKLAPPRSLRELLRKDWRRGFILQDPRTSTPGLAFVLYADKVLGPEGAPGFWAALRGQWLTLSPGWDGAYGLFLKKEAPLVWSYVTSQAYHAEKGQGARYQAVLFDEGQPLQIEGAVVVKGSIPATKDGEKQRALARQFLEYLISAEAQALLPTRNWMLPAVRDATLPESFRALPKVKVLPTADEASEVKAALERWQRGVSGTGR